MELNNVKSSRHVATGRDAHSGYQQIERAVGRIDPDAHDGRT